MRRMAQLALLSTLVPAMLGGGYALAQRSYTPGPANITLPADWQARFIRYAVVERVDRKQVMQMYVNPEAYAAAKPGEPLPQGTLLVMAAYRARLGPDGTPLRDQQGRMIPEATATGYNVQEKQPGWGEGYGPERRNGEWEYARFQADGSRNDGSVDSCFSCHLQTRPQQDFAFNFWDDVQTRR